MPGLRAYYLAQEHGERFCILHTPPVGVASRGALLFVPPFAEELNKSRRMIALAARRFSAQGWTVLVADLYGTGDSDGDFGEATWQGWCDDLVGFAAHLRSFVEGPLWLWALRGGALLAAELLGRLGPQVDGLLLWHPQLSGKLALTQFLRLRVAAEMGSDVAGRVDTKGLRALVAAGERIEVAGYALGEGLCSGLEAAEFDLPERWGSWCVWLELGAALAPASARRIDALCAAGRRVHAEAIAGPAFWQTVEIETVVALIERSATLLAEAA